MNKSTLVFVASPKSHRYSYMAVVSLLKNNIITYPVGLRKGFIGNKEIITGFPLYEDLDTLTLYINPRRQIEFYDYFLSLKPRRIIFNPGTENPELVKLAQKNSIITENACTLVLLNLNAY